MLSTVVAVLVEAAAFTFQLPRPHPQLRPTCASHVEDLPFDGCWGIQTFDINPSNDTKIDTILQRLCSPAPQSYYVMRRALECGQEQNLTSVLWKLQHLLKPGYQWAISEDNNQVQVVSTTDLSTDGWRILKPPLDQQSTLEMAHHALELAGSCDETSIPKESIIEAKERLKLTLGTDIRGRRSADAAFSFAVAGVDDPLLYQMLANVAQKELERVGKRSSFRSKYILQMVEKLAAAGLRDDAGELYNVAAECLEFKGEHTDVVKLLQSNRFDLLSTRPLLWLWRFSSKQTKVRPPNITPSSNDFRWMESLQDPGLPLVVDIGCGMGVSLLGLATMDKKECTKSRGDSLIDFAKWQDANLVGCDLSSLTIGYASGIASRWHLSSRLQYVCKPANELFNGIEQTYAGKVSLVMIQFPSPYRFKDKSDGNQQLPGERAGFMVSEGLLRTIFHVLDTDGLLLLQSNVEDVAVTMRNLAQRVGFESVSVDKPRSVSQDGKGGTRLPQRTIEWIEAGGQRAIGGEWSSVPLLPQRASTETDVACEFQGTPVHRCLLRKSL